MGEAIGTQVEAAAVAGVTDRQFRAYTKSQAQPTFETVARLAQAAGFDLNWAATGRGEPRGPAPRPVATELMARVVDVLTRVYGEGRIRELTIPGAELGRLAAVEYDGLVQLVDPGARPDDDLVLRALAGIESRHRRLREDDARLAAKGTRKRQA